MAILWIFISLMNIWGNLALPYSLGNKISQQGELVGFKFNENKAMLEWSNNIETTVELETTSFEDCIYEGTFTEEQDSAILVTGCENEVKNIQIQSLLFGDIVASSFNGKVKLLTGTDHLHDIIANDIDEPEDNKTNEFLNRTKRSYVSDPDFSDQFPFGLEDYDAQFDGDTGESNLPTSLIMNLNVYMSDSWREKSNYDRNAKRVVAHAQQFLQHRTLDTKIVLVPRYLQYDGDHEPSNSGLASFRKNMPSPKKTISSNCNTVLSNEGGTNQLLTAKKSCSKTGCTNGIAYCPGICSCNSRTASGITSWWNPSKELVELAETFTHEIAHNLGIYHDFETKEDNPRGHMTRYRTCGPGKWNSGSDNQVMNYDQPRQPTWSTCSNQDFQDYYTAQKIKYDGKFCLKEKFENVGGVNQNLKLWPNGIIPYRFDSSVSSSDRKGFEQVVDYLNNKLNGCLTMRLVSSINRLETIL